MTPTPLLIDTDPGVDDAWAILMAGQRQSHQILGLSVVGGNVGLAATCRNACRLVDLLGGGIPVYPGAARPLLGGAGDAAHVHGSDGFGDADLALALHRPADLPAALAIIETARAHAGRLQILALGPLTNLALALRLEPDLPAMVNRLVVMGGALDGIGNLTAQAEFNFAFDPEAAEIVLRDWNELVLVDWSVTLMLAPAITAVEELLEFDNPRARLMRQITGQVRRFIGERGADRWALADPLAAHVLLDGAHWPSREHAVKIELDEGPARGASRLLPPQPGRALVRVPDYTRAHYLDALAGALA